MCQAVGAFNQRLERAEGHGSILFEFVDFNAVLLSETCKELIGLKAAQTAIEQQVGATVLKVTEEGATFRSYHDGAPCSYRKPCTAV